MRPVLICTVAAVASFTLGVAVSRADQVPVPPPTTAAQVALPAHMIFASVANQNATVYVFSPKRGRYVYRARYGLATGKSGFDTPRGIFYVVNKVKDPSWSPPPASWVPKAWQGKTFGPDDPRNPLNGTWLGLGGLPPNRSGIGFHGTDEDSSIGARASHGCLRMHEQDSNNLARIVGVGTPVIIR